jgi:WD40 repeat protein
MPSGTVYMNWPLLPSSKAPMNTTTAATTNNYASTYHRVTTLEFSPDGTQLAIGNARGRVLLYQLNHFL